MFDPTSAGGYEAFGKLRLGRRSRVAGSVKSDFRYW